MTVDQIERAVERMFDALDAEPMSQEEYDRRADAISAWADAQIAHRRALDARPHICDEPEYSRYPLIQAYSASVLHEPDTLEAYP